MRDHDYSAAVDFLAKFFSETESAVEIRALPNEYGAGPSRPLFTRDPLLVEQHCVRWDDIDRAVYFGVCTRTSGVAKGGREHLQELPALWVDIDCYKLGIDTDTAIAALLSFSVPPSVVVLSGGGVHAYWLLLRPIDVSQSDPAVWPRVELAVVGALKQLAGVFAGDLAVCDLARIMRLPGTHNTKTGELRPCVVVPSSTWACVDFDELCEVLDRQAPLLVVPEADLAPVVDDNPWLAMARALTIKRGLDVEAELERMTFGAIDGTGISATQTRVAASLAVKGVPDEEITQILLSATHKSAARAGQAQYWNWHREEFVTIPKRIATGKAKFVDPENPPPRRSATVHPIRGSLAVVADTAPDEATPSPGDTVPLLAGKPLNDIGNALRLIEHHHLAMRYVVGVGWHVWDQRRYKRDPSIVAARRLAHDTLKRMMLEVLDLPGREKEDIKRKEHKAKFVIGSGNTNKIAGMLSQAEPYLCAEAEQLDSNPLLLNCLNGTLDLETMQLRPHAQGDLITKLLPVAYDPQADCPAWEKFLVEIFNENAELVRFVQCAIGYSLSGMTSEQVVFILHGSGSNGKSVLLEVIAALLSDYAAQCPSSTFAAKDNSIAGIPNDIARLAGARFVSIIETEEDKKLAEALVKQVTGGDRITARFLRQEFFEFVPQFKLWLATNHKPRIRGIDNAIWRRIRLIPFGVTFVDAEEAKEGDLVKDFGLKDRLLSELPGILRWAVEGFSAWREAGGLHPPVVVKEATKDYRDSEDLISGFVEDRCHMSAGLRCKVGDLYTAYKKWSAENGEAPISLSAFGSALDSKGFPPERGTKGVRMRKGLDLNDIGARAVHEEPPIADHYPGDG